MIILKGATQDEVAESTDTEAIAPRTPRGGRSRRKSTETEVLTPRRTSRRRSSVEEPAPTPVKIQQSLAQITESETEQEEQVPESKTESEEPAIDLYSINVSKTYDDDEQSVTTHGDSMTEQKNISIESKEIESLSDDAKNDEKENNVAAVEPVAALSDQSESGGVKPEIEKTVTKVEEQPEKESPSRRTSSRRSLVEESSTPTKAEEKIATPIKSDEKQTTPLKDKQPTPIKKEEKQTTPIKSDEKQPTSVKDKQTTPVKDKQPTPSKNDEKQTTPVKKEEQTPPKKDVATPGQNTPRKIDESPSKKDEVMETQEEMSQEDHAETSLDKADTLEEDEKMLLDDSVHNKSSESNIEESDKDNISENTKFDDSELACDSPVDTSKAKKKEKRSRWSNFQDQKQESNDKAAKSEEAKSDDSRRSLKRRHSHSRSPVKMLTEEDEVQLESSDTNVLLSWFDSDLHLCIDRDNLCGASPLTAGALSHVWAGARTNKGVTSGCGAYEVLVERHLKVDQPDESSHLIRIGFSTSSNTLQLGEDALSFGYESSGKFVSNNEFTDYGVQIKETDVVGAYLDLDSTPCTIKFTVNGEEQGIAKEFEKSILEGKALFPHVLTKNISFKINFGQNEKSLLNRPKVVKVVEDKKEVKDEPVQEPMETDTSEESKEVKSTDVEMAKAADASEEKEASKEVQGENAVKETKAEETVKENAVPEPIEEDVPELFILPGYEYIGKFPLDSLVDGPLQPDTRKECEVLMLCGLPGVGKTHWVEKWVREHPEKRYTVLGTHELVNRMKTNGEPKKSSYKGSWQALLEACSKSISELVNIAGKRRRNVIIDQNNVFSAVQIRKISNFGEFVRKAIVIVPSEEEWNNRKAAKGQFITEEVTESEMLTMKANFVLPEVSDYFDQVIFAELSEQDSSDLIEKYNKEGKDAGYAMRPAKRSRFDNSSDRSADRHSNSSQGNRQSSDRRYNDRSDRRRSSDRSQGFNRRGGNDHRKHNDRMDRGGGGPPHRWGGGPPRFGGPPPPPHWAGRGGHRDQWRGGGGGGRDRPHQAGGWRSGGGERGPPHGGRGGSGDHGHRGGPRGGPPDHVHRGGRGGGDHRGGRGGGPSRGGAGAPQHMRDGGRWNPRGSAPGRGGAGGDRRGQHSGRGHPQGGQGHWAGNNAAWNNEQQQWNQQQWGGAQNWSADQVAQDWSGQHWNQNWQQNWNQQNWGNGWKGYGAQNWGQYWNQWNQQGQQQAEGNSAGTNASGAADNSGGGANQNPSTTGSSSTTSANSSQYSTSYPNVQYTGAAGTNTTTSSSSSQYPAQYSTDGNTANQTTEQMAQVYQSWAQYAQAFANYGQQQNAATAGSGNSQKAATGFCFDFVLDENCDLHLSLHARDASGKSLYPALCDIHFKEKN
ncbi:uncharacterized protein LOC113389492 [Ctenocephalides felis]|uniref:uncharacterized protein LOC113389492 n=1 Tax=Ctenocephalides felis TaxID=7515 RepID=UPI000E6E3B70|nr:uncharacterized protein LOC113389492 [Ctenocephalides felis]